MSDWGELRVAEWDSLCNRVDPENAFIDVSTEEEVVVLFHLFFTIICADSLVLPEEIEALVSIEKVMCPGFLPRGFPVSHADILLSPLDVEGLGSTFSEASESLRERIVNTALVAVCGSGKDSIGEMGEEMAIVHALGDALGVSPRSLRAFEHMLQGREDLAAGDMLRRRGATKEDQMGLTETKLMHEWPDPDPTLAAKFHALGQMEDGTLGKTYFGFARRHGFALPGEMGGPPVFPFVVHDVIHVLSGYPPTPEGEMLTLAFTGGMRREKGAEVILHGLLAFHFGVRLDPVVAPFEHKLNTSDIIDAIGRGSGCTTNLFSRSAPSLDSMWAVQVEELQRRFGIVPNRAELQARLDEEHEWFFASSLQPGN